MKRILIYLVTTFGLTWTFWSIGISGPVVMGMPVAELAAADCLQNVVHLGKMQEK